MTEFGTTYPAATAKPEPTAPGLVVHAVFDLSRYSGSDAQRAFSRADTDEEIAACLVDMPDATVQFFEIPEGEDLFDVVDARPRDRNGFALWDTVWLIEIGDLGAIEAVIGDGDEYDVMSGGDLLRLKPGQIKSLKDLTPDEDAALQRLADEERAAARVSN